MVTFRAIAEGDFARLALWLKDPDVARWFDEPGYIDELRACKEDARVRQWIVEEDGDAVAYLQDYDIHGWEAHYLGFLPRNARGVDLFIGEAAQRGRGLGRLMLRVHARAMFADGIPAIGIDPHAANKVAHRAYLAAGFKTVGAPLETKWGRLQPMELWPEDLGDWNMPQET